ncbi:MAG: hypothetical protein R3Y53_05075 [Bacillota bacterium]
MRMIVSGGAKGIDTLAETYADKKRLSKCIIGQEYKKDRKRGVIIRNKEIVEFADEVLAF